MSSPRALARIAGSFYLTSSRVHGRRVRALAPSTWADAAATPATSAGRPRSSGLASPATWSDQVHAARGDGGLPVAMQAHRLAAAVFTRFLAPGIESGIAPLLLGPGAVAELLFTL